MVRLCNMLALVAALFFVACTAQPTLLPETTTVLLNDGEAESVVTCVAQGPETNIDVSGSSIYTVGTITATPADNGFTNYSIPLSFEAGVGVADITVTVGSETVSGKVIAAGLVIKDSGKIVSGDSGPGVTVGVEGTFKFEVEAIDVDGSVPDVSGATFTGSATSGTYLKQLDTATTSITSTTFTLGIAKFRTSPAGFVVDIDVPSITLNGESFETKLSVSQDPDTAGCVAIGGTYTSINGKVKIPMYNVKSGSSVSIAVGSSSGSADLSASDLTMPDQSIEFSFATAGTATITCDGETAYSAEPVVIEVTSTAEALAKDNTATLPKDNDSDQLTAKLSVTDSSPDLLTLSDATLVIGEFCKTIAGKSCVLTDVTSGSAVLDCAGNIEVGTGPDKEAALKTSIDTCEFQKNIKKPCDWITYLQVSVKAVGGAAVPHAAGLATWTIVLIAALGALALIVLIMLGLLAVYRRSAEQSESDYSSSGPLGVPDPSDLLYEQSIVRDIYGRGDYPDGGPTAAVAQEREREAALREEFPRPPSSSGLSRGSATDDASSTYSV